LNDDEPDRSRNAPLAALFVFPVVRVTSPDLSKPSEELEETNTAPPEAANKERFPPFSCSSNDRPEVMLTFPPFPTLESPTEISIPPAEPLEPETPDSRIILPLDPATAPPDLRTTSPDTPPETAPDASDKRPELPNPDIVEVRISIEPLVEPPLPDSITTCPPLGFM